MEARLLGLPKPALLEQCVCQDILKWTSSILGFQCLLGVSLMFCCQLYPFVLSLFPQESHSWGWRARHSAVCLSPHRLHAHCSACQKDQVWKKKLLGFRLAANPTVPAPLHTAPSSGTCWSRIATAISQSEQRYLELCSPQGSFQIHCFKCFVQWVSMS